MKKNRIETPGSKIHCMILGEMTFFTQVVLDAPPVFDKNNPPLSANDVMEAVKNLTIREIVGDKNEQLANLSLKSINIIDKNIDKIRRIK